MIKIEGPKGPGATGKTEKAKKSGSTSGTSFSAFLSEAGDVEAPAAPAGVAGVNLFLALQVAEHASDQDQRKRAITHADDLLSELEDLQTGLLLGSYTINQLRNLGQRLRQQRLQIEDQNLLNLLTNIELRAAVELAKYE